MVCYSPTLVAERPKFPLFLPPVPTPYPTPLPRRDPNSLTQQRARWLSRHSWQKEIEELSEEEVEFEDMVTEVQRRGFEFLVPIGRTLTQQEEKSDAQGEESSDGSSHSGADEGENDAELAEQDDGGDVEEVPEAEVDLDAEMDDLDHDADGDDELYEDLDEAGNGDAAGGWPS